MARRKSAERTLVTDLQQQVIALVDDLRSQSETDPALHAKLTTEHQRAQTAQRIATNYTDWREDRLTQIAVAWVLGTVFVRYCEDNELIDDPWISGPDERLNDAEDRHAAHFRTHPDQNDRDWLLASFTHLADMHPAVAGLFDKAHNPLWEANPSYEAATALLNFWRTPNADGVIPHLFQGQDTRFLGDLYQHLSTHAQKTYALLQTPDFVEEFILDLTLTPALEEFGLTPEWRHTPPSWQGPRNHAGKAIGLRTIDPACGSGHFLLGLFHRILAAWETEAPGLPRWELIRRTLDSVHGCDKNPFAAAIARFRLLVAALTAAGEPRLASAPSFPINIAVGDSLLHGRDAPGIQGDLLTPDEPFYYVTEDVSSFTPTCDLLGRGGYHVVVGNPPYITVKDSQENQNYRNGYDACGGTYALSVPFAQRIFELAVRGSGTNRDAGYVGQITANSFMKREFGKKLIQQFFQTIELTHVIDTSGAYIPGHGTPTVILAGRNRIPFEATPIRAVLGIRGEPGQPKVAAEGLVWTSIVRQINEPETESSWVSVSDITRTALRLHPWSLKGGGSKDLFAAIERRSSARLSSLIEHIGRTTATGEDDLYILPDLETAVRLGERDFVREIVVGDQVRDFHASNVYVRNPYSDSTNRKSIDPAHRLATHSLWPGRTGLRSRMIFGKTILEKGQAWTDFIENYSRKLTTRLGITFAFVSTHNHFALDRDGRLFNRSAPVIKLPKETSEDDHLGLLGLLNSSMACFWLKQVSHDKGSQSGTGGFMHDEWERFFEFTGTKLQDFPLPETMPLKLGKLLDALAGELQESQPSAVCAKAVPTGELLETARRQYEVTRARMIAVQEELDWQVYGIYGLLNQDEIKRVLAADSVAVSAQLGERAFEIVLARQVAAGLAETVWFARHGSEPVTDVPAGWPTDYADVVRARVELIAKRTDIALLERPDYKRRWAQQPWEEKQADALASWMLDRCERKDLWFTVRDGLQHPRTLTIGELADRFKDDSELRSVATLYAEDHLDKRDVPLAEVLDYILREQHVPYLSTLRYKDSGLRKRAVWERTWELQRREDREDRKLDIPIPPKYVTGDFRTLSYWSQRGKLDVPKERFVSYLGAARHKDDPLLLGWAGWDHKDQAQALVNLVNDRQFEDGWGREQLLPILTGLLEVMPWVRQWHGEYDAEWGGNPAEEFQAFLDEKTAEFQISERELQEWRPSKEFLKRARG